MLADLLLVVLIVLVITLVLITTATLTAVWQLQRRNRLSPKVPTTAPLDWLWSPMQPARMHRRLRTVVRHVEGADTALPRSDAPLRLRLVDQAHAIDWHLVEASSTPRRHRRAVLRELDGQVREVEDLSRRFDVLARPAGVPGSGWDGAPTRPVVQIAELRADLEALESAHAELDEIERLPHWPPADAAARLPAAAPEARLIDPRHPAAGDAGTPEAST
jgi:hypothetical protein